MGLFDNIRFPYFNFQELNLDWLLHEVKRIAGFMPADGNPGDILTKKDSGAAWEPPEAVNININALPEDTEIGDNDQLVFYDISAQANRKIKPPNLLDSMMSNATPLMDGTGSAGTSKKPARYDHRHPTDTSRAPASYFQNNALKVANGGTGATTAAAARSSLGLGDVSTEDVLPITKGGTGATTDGDARVNLGLDARFILRKTAASNSDHTITFVASESSHMFMFVNGNRANERGFYCIDKDINLPPVVTPLLDATALTFSSADNVLTIHNGGTTYCYFMLLGNYGASVPVWN